MIVRLKVGDSFWIVIVIVVVIAFVIQTFDQINSTIGSTSQIVPHTLCVYTHKITLVLYVFAIVAAVGVVRRATGVCECVLNRCCVRALG